jgi:hypothetical protein
MLGKLACAQAKVGAPPPKMLSNQFSMLPKKLAWAPRGLASSRAMTSATAGTMAIL